LPQVSAITRALRNSAIEFLILLGLWMLFVSNMHTAEFLAGVAAALIASVADAVLKAEGFAKFKPRFKWLLLMTWEFWYIISDTWAIMLALARRMLGKKSRAQFQTVKFDVGGDDAQSWARRALVTVYTTIPPNSIVIGIDRERELMLLHEVVPAPTPEIAKRLGAAE
jgi:multisubunit Na+/H+ antiporter MnhE subunit